MKTQSPITQRLIAVSVCLLAFSLLWSTTQAHQEPGEEKAQQAAVSRQALRQIVTELTLVRDSISKDLGRLEEEYMQLRAKGSKAGDPDEKAMSGRYESKREDFNRLVDQIKRLNKMTGGK